MRKFYQILIFFISSTILFGQANKKITGPEKQKNFLKQIWGKESILPDEHRRISASLESLTKTYNNTREDILWQTFGPSPATYNKKVFFPNAKTQNASGRIRDIAVDVQKIDEFDTGIRVLSATGGIFGVSEISIGGGLSLVHSFNLSKSLPAIFTSAFAFHPYKKGLILVGSGEPFITCGQGLFRSVDNGETWNQVEMDLHFRYPCLIHKIFFDPVVPNVVHATTSNGYMKSEDEGLSWNKYSDNIDMTGLVQDKNSWSTLYCAGGNGQLYVSYDNGDNWNTVASNLPLNESYHSALAIDPVYSNRLYVFMSNKDNRTLGLFKSIDKGNSFTTCTFNGGPMVDMHWSQGYYNNVVEVSPIDNEVVFAGAGNYLRSSNTTDYQAVDPHHADQHAIVFDSKGTMYLGNDGGLFTSTDNGITYSGKYNIFPTMQFYHAGVSRGNPNYMSGGTQDNGTVYRNNEGWYTLLNGDGTSGCAHHDIPNKMYGSDNSGQLRYSNDGGRNWATDIDICWGKYMFVESEKSNVVSGPNSLLAYCERDVFRQIGSTWSKITPTSMAGTIQYITVSNKSSTASRANIYLSIEHADPNFRIAVRRRDGDSWSTRGNTNGLPNDTYYRIFPHPYKFDVAYLICLSTPASGFGNKVFKTDNAGLSWTNITGNMPNVPLTCLAAHPQNDNILMVGTAGFGFLESIDGGTSWNTSNEGTAVSTIVSGIDVIDSTSRNGSVHLIAYTLGNSFIKRHWPNVFVNNIDQYEEKAANRMEIINTAQSGNYQIHFTHDKKETITINAISSNGQIIKTQKSIIYPGNSDIELDLSSASYGLYVVQTIYSDNSTVTRKLIHNQ
ncbi:MAG: hypothetical protein HOP11_07220 [Saprospiraceae bacterium]|nr:hypothetical protein [Saprospiraceae bacterium]